MSDNLAVDYEKLQYDYAECDHAYKALQRRHDALTEIVRQIAQGDRAVGNLTLAQIAYRQACELAGAALTLDGEP